MTLRSRSRAGRRDFVALLCAGAATLALSAPAAQAAGWPEKPVKLVVPYPPGGATDVIGRVIAPRLSTALGQPVVVENRGGAGGNLGADQVAKAAPDGYTLLMGAMTSHSIMATLERKTIRYDILKDLTAVSLVGSVPLVFVTHPSVPVKDLKELVAYARANPGKLTYASSGAGAPQRMGAELFKRVAGVDMLHVPYKGSGPAMTDLVGGQVLTMAETVPASLQFIKSGKLKALAVLQPARISMLPDVPTAAEAGLAGLEVSSLFGVMAPAKTPRPIVERLNAELQKILATPDVKEQMLAQGAYALQSTPAEADARLRTEVATWARVIQDANVQPD